MPVVKHVHGGSWRQRLWHQVVYQDVLLASVCVCVCVATDVCLLFARSTSGVFKCDEIFMELRSAAA